MDRAHLCSSSRYPREQSIQRRRFARVERVEVAGAGYLNVFYNRATFLKNASIAEEINNKRDKLTIRKYLFTAQFALVNPKYEVSPYIALTEIPDANLKLLDTINKTLSPKVAKSLYGKELGKWIKERKTNEEN